MIKVIIICKKHGEFEQRPTSHLRYGCKACGFENTTNKKKYDNLLFIEKAMVVHNNRYDYSKVDYINCITNINIICQKHGDFEQKPSHHLQGHGCNKCAIDINANNQQSDTNKFIEKSILIHKNKYDYSKVDYRNSRTKVIIICKKHGEFEQRPNDNLSGYGCPYCVNKTEQKLYEQLSPYYNNLKQQYKVEWCKNKTFLPFDFVLDDFKIIIELDGRQHFEQVYNWSSPDEILQNDKYKIKCANSNNYSVIRILQNDVHYDTYDWLTELNNNIDKIKNDSIVQNIFMCKNNEYNKFL
jgi:very-short-patch-repair endonuclease